ncbi:hypothetical protein FHU28_005734 [Micromonospora echinospora]|uniref:MYXO-CTERM domain-containing protein n=1 Tax=Micromonospora echinospora TaxID=1877 RepID=A0ABR6MMF3_MICEC|nr:hypothetical protein [Micromonospora echinospora]MBB5115895.1 hypothetical protein [Micromonospora echinospora]
MAKKMLGKVVASAALGGAGLLVFTPGLAFAGGHDEGKVIAKPHVVKAGDTVELLAICSEPQKHATVWSKVTGKVDLHPARGGEHGDWADRGGDWGGDEDWGWDDKGPDSKDDHGKGPDSKDDHGKGPDSKDDHGKGPDGRGEPGGDGHGPGGNAPGGYGPGENGPGGNGPGGDGMPQPPANQPQPGGAGAGTAVDPGDWQGHDEYGQDAEPGWEKEKPGATDWTRDAHGPDGKDRYGKDAKDEHGKDDRGGRPDDKGKDGTDEHGSWQDGKDGWQDGKDDWQASGGAWQDDKGDYGKDAERDYDKGDYGKDAERDYDKGDYGKDGWEHGKDFVYYGEATVSHDARPGRYELKGSCGEGELVVLPRGGVDGGDGGMASTGVDRNLATGGAGMIGAAALGGLVLLRRRRAGELV